MPQSTLGEVLRVIQRMYALQGSSDLTDRELVERYMANQDETAFAALVKRHGPMVFGVSRRLLRDNHQAEDVFQATFLVLVRRIGSIKRRQSVGSWLYGVARRIALQARTHAAAQRRREREAGSMRSGQPGDELSLQDLRSVLDEEIGLLPEKYRAPLVLCYLEGNTYEQAARELSCAKSTLDSRLARARELLRRQLERRGIGLAAAALTTALAEMVAAAPLPALLTIKTIKAAALVAAGKSVAGCLSAGAVALAEGAVAGIIGVKAKLAIIVLALGLAVGAGLAGSGGVAPKEVPAAQGPVTKEVARGPAKKEPTLDQYGDPLPEGAVARLGTVRFRHGGILSALNFAHGGQTLVGHTNYGGIIVWDATTGKELHRIGSGTMDVSPDESTLATVRSNTADDTVQLMLWDIRTAKLIGTVPLPGKAPEGEGLCFVRFAADGKSVAYSWRDYAHIVDLPSGKVRAKLGGSQAHRIWSIALSPDGKTLALGVSGLLLGDIAGGNKMRRLNPPLPSWTTAVGFSPDGRIVAWGIQDHVLLSDPRSGKELNRLQAPMGGVQAVAFTPDGKTILCASLDGKIRVWDVATGNLRRTHDGRMRWVFTMALSPDGKTVALGTGHQIIRHWDVVTGQELHTQFQGHVSSVGGLAFSDDGQILVSSSNDEEIRMWSTRNWKQTGLLPGIDRALGRSPTLSFSPDGKDVAFVSDRKTIRTRDIAKGHDTLAITVPDANDVVSARFSTDGRSLISLDRTIDSRYDQTGPFRVQRWDASTGQRQHLWVLPEKIRVFLAGDTLLLTADGKRVLRSGRDAGKGEGAIRLYDSDSGSERLFAGRENELLGSLALSPDGRLVAAGEWGGNDGVSIWEMITRKEIFLLKGHERSVDAMAWSRDGRVVAAADFWYPGDKSQDCSIRVWDAVTGKELAQFGGLKNDVAALTFSPDDTYLAAGLRDSTIVVWDVSEILKNAKPTPRKPSLKEFEECWFGLASHDSRLAHAAAWKLTLASNQATTFLRGKVHPLDAVDAKKVQGWIADLGSDRFRVRESASKELVGTGGQVVPHVQRALQREVSLETRRRLEHVLRQVFTILADVPSPQTVRTIRAIMVLERIGSPDAQAVLQTLASGAPGARETEEAKASLERLKMRVSP